ncbi:glycosyl transferase family 1 [Skermanella stibiiresistens SB22]|uniref:Glycosyl transferase family 1 n=1 Tax=Skermanella stibiiresistens SB22 TaxID=1385369 RepID=W9H7A0_9PROT|nr:glycosyltransferase family 4 protein [Skermanella stibiiresistens]EWY39653.1 glycosyl transferase family 1 [Skermanella stibiiresistens SB22]
MRILFVHNHFPGHYQHVAAALAADPRNQVVFITKDPSGSIPGVDKRVFTPARGPAPGTHHYVRAFEDAVLHGQAVYRLCDKLKREGFTPDLVCAHAGFGPGLYIKDIFPDTPLLGYFEWFYNAKGSDADYLNGPVGADDACRIRSRNAAIQMELANCDWGLCPTVFQRGQFPAAFQNKLTLMHDGIDTDFFSPDPEAPMILPGLDLSGAKEVVTYATRGMEPYRGFPQFMRAADILLRRRPDLHIIVGGDDSVSYSRLPPPGQTYKRMMLEELPGLDLSRLHFVGPLAYPLYRDMLRASDVHVYLTVPFVLSWSLLESQSTGCMVVAADNAAVREVMDHGVNGLLADFFSPDDIAAKVIRGLDQRRAAEGMRAAARRRVLERYALADLLPRHLQLIRHLAGSVGMAEVAELELAATA